jgi:hypothetical protein
VDFQFQSFSDSIVLSMQASKDIGFLTTSISELAIRLLQDGLLIRGAISKGGLHHKDGVMFGPAFLDAYAIEKELRKVPACDRR